MSTKSYKLQLSSMHESLLNAHWLRPETAMWRAEDILSMKSMNIKFKKKSLDLGCGDGIFTYI